MEKKPNRLAQESSPYLLQHAYNPVHWFPWGPEALQKAQDEQKPILVSIGYAACHWCHVMEHESFEQEEIAQVMNQHFVCIKVDREERPDVDQVYMDAVQAMGVQGGWPLNVFLNPDAKPFYGGTYYPPQTWRQLLQSIAQAYIKSRKELDTSAEQFAQHLNQSELARYGLRESNPAVNAADLEQMFQRLKSRFDLKRGGTGEAPKFPMPSIWRFLLRYYHHSQDPAALEQVNLTLEEIALGGIYDQVGGGFARYSTDPHWLVPHFEKMLYDNAQLISLYAEAYQVTRNDLYRQVVLDTVAFVERELTHPDGGFYSSLDADSEGEEGKFYVFTQAELNGLLGEQAELASHYYNTSAAGNWEHGVNILHRRQTDEAFAADQGLSVEELQERVQHWKDILLQARAQRVRPGLDDKILTSWNALMVTGLTDAYKAFQEPKLLELACTNAHFLLQYLKQGNQLFHNYKAGKATVAGFLEDYALLIQALIGLYQVTFEEKWLKEARLLTQETLTHFFDPQEELFFFTGATGEQLIARKKELFDNVIPASNSVMAMNLHLLGLYFDKDQHSHLSEKMLARVRDLVVQEPSHLANWASLYYLKVQPAAEVAIIGPEAPSFRNLLHQHFLPNVLLAGTKEAGNSGLPLLEDRYAQDGNTTLYVCVQKTCQLPVQTVAAALEQIGTLTKR
ncbi:thioredoxin domain-containing protein [Rufibacter glacialis]|uniref:Thioredoxin domain-containing protein n=1 Tax=Rufibacter glacialis TaxID=1259555 RepID=A0A5M8QL44_9BACT|nr:thioredoxin domain-containing protein [Rufibacter glacialis]KAA6435871.1 thioredoxin domain-containing protein [Rufibacter glacialis]GGK67304.1 thioredoxin [Rufibacter glacialis]